MVEPSADHRPSGAHVVIHLLRHGLVHNPQGVLYGRLPDFHLSDVGRAMADRAAEYFAQADVRYVAASPLERAQETAEPVAQKLGLDIVTDDRLIEPTNVFEGTAFAVGDGLLKKPKNWAKIRNPFMPSWGESYLSIARRMVGAVYAAVQAVTEPVAAGTPAVGHEAIVVSHQLPIWTLRRFLDGKRLWHNPSQRQCGLASVTSLVFIGGVLQTIRYSEPAADLVPAASAGSTGA